MRRMLLVVALISAACGGATEAEQPEELGRIDVGGKSDEGVSRIDVRIQPGKDKTLRFDSAAALTISLFQRGTPARATLQLVARDGERLEVSHHSELGRPGDAVASHSPSLEVSASGAVREYELTISNVDDAEWLDGVVVFSEPVETSCIAYETAEHTFEPLAICRVISQPKLEAESKKSLESIDFCVGTGQRVDFFDSSKRHDTLQVIGEYSYVDPDAGDATFTATLRDPADLESSSGNTLVASYRRSQEVVTQDAALLGPEDEREFREFEYIYAYDLETETFEFRVKSRPDIFPNWFWEFATELECEPR